MKNIHYLGTDYDELLSLGFNNIAQQDILKAKQNNHHIYAIFYPDILHLAVIDTADLATLDSKYKLLTECGYEILVTIDALKQRIYQAKLDLSLGVYDEDI